MTWTYAGSSCDALKYTESSYKRSWMSGVRRQWMRSSSETRSNSS